MARKNIQLAAIAPFGLRITPDIKSQLEATARANNRSMNAEINYMIEESLARRADTSGKSPSALFKPRSEAAETDGPYNPWVDDAGGSAIDAIDDDILEELAGGLLKLARKISDAEDAATARFDHARFYQFALAELDSIETSNKAEVARVFDELMVRAASHFRWPAFLDEGPEFHEDEPEERP